jgi:hypothetical protein
MNRDDAIEVVFEAMDNIQDYDTTLHDYAAAAVKALGWHSLATTLPEIDQVVVCTDGTARWLDKRTKYQPDMKWTGHTPTHWHPILEISDDIKIMSKVNDMASALTAADRSPERK